MPWASEDLTEEKVAAVWGGSEQYGVCSLAWHVGVVDLVLGRDVAGRGAMQLVCIGVVCAVPGEVWDAEEVEEAEGNMR